MLYPSVSSQHLNHRISVHHPTFTALLGPNNERQTETESVAGVNRVFTQWISGVLMVVLPTVVK